MAENYIEPTTGLAFPDKIKIFKSGEAFLLRGEPATFQDTRAGMSVKYIFINGEIIQATVFIYDAGVEGIANGLKSNITKENCRDIIEVHQLSAVGYQDIKIEETDRDGERHRIGPLSACYVNFTFIGSMNRKRNSFSYVTGYNGKIVKIRVTNLVEHSLMADAARLSLLQALGEQMSSR